MDNAPAPPAPAPKRRRAIASIPDRPAYLVPVLRPAQPPTSRTAEEIQRAVREVIAERHRRQA